MAINIDEGEPGTFKDRYYLERDPHRFLEGALIAAWAVGIDDDLHLPARRISRLPRDSRARDRGAAGRIRRARCRAIHLRRGAGAYICGEESAMIESIEGKRGDAAPAPALRRAGRPVRPADARAQHGDAALGARHPREGRRLVRRRTAATAARGCARSRCRGRVQEARRAPRAGRHHGARADRRILRRHARRARALRATCRAARRAASCRRRWPTSRSTSTRCSQYGCFIGSAAVDRPLGPRHARATRRAT